MRTPSEQRSPLCASFAAEANVPARIARCFAFVGPWLPRDEHFAIGNFIGNALRGEPVEVRARHPVIRSYLHADDLAVWLLRLATAAGDGCETVNVGSGEARDVARSRIDGGRGRRRRRAVSRGGARGDR